MRFQGSDLNSPEHCREREGRFRRGPQNPPRAFSFYNDADDDDIERSQDSREDESEPENPEELQRSEEPADIESNEHDLYPTETKKRRERRHAQASREREGVRRSREGLPRNYLLVDEHSKEPYGQGVSSWRKELMLLSRKLDPTIGNINRQPQVALKEIADWNQHTWEYSGPIKERYVKEVIARGVTLRRSELWKKIRLEEPKPEDVSDRTWRSLARQLESPATIRKAEICSRANASRVNFGRTRPSGEVGVRERLRRHLKRSPDPEEVRFEMARNKGYSGRSKSNKSSDNIMHGSWNAGDRLEDSEIRHNSQHTEGASLRNDNSAPEGRPERAQFYDDSEPCSQPARKTGYQSGMLSISEEQLAQHPMVLKLMQRLEALEGRKRQSAAVEEVVGGQSNPKAAVEEISEEVPCEEDLVDQGLGAQNSETIEVGLQSAKFCMV